MNRLLRGACLIAVAALLSLGARSASAQGCCKAGLCKIPQLPTASAATQINSMLDQFDRPAGTPATPASARSAGAPSTRTPTATATEISLVNPLGSNQKIEYVLDGKAYALEPGTTLTMQAAQARRIEFSRNGNGDKAAYRVSRGVYEFAMTDNGWELYRTARLASER